ncbi:MAG: IS110 family transposase [Rhodospirillales bacterium]|nr:IS110 family transposase [Rhodospirillales bacterium]
MTEATTTTAGIDTSKAWLDIVIHGAAGHRRFANDGCGWRALAAELTAAAGVGRVGIEATGGYERGIAKHLRAAGFTVLVLQPVQVRAYARVRLRRAKNDVLDAAPHAAGAATSIRRRSPPTPRLADLAGPLTFVEQTEDDIARLKVRLEHVDDRRLLAGGITRLKARRRTELRRIADKLRAHDDLARRLDLVLSIPGIGERTAIALVVRLPELGKVGRGQIAALAGLAPFDADSGAHKGQRHIAGGRARVRRSLFAAALPAAFRWNQPLIAFYARLTARGKSHTATLVACARKLLIYANTVVSRQTPWTEKPAEA